MEGSSLRKWAKYSSVGPFLPLSETVIVQFRKNEETDVKCVGWLPKDARLQERNEDLI